MIDLSTKKVLFCDLDDTLIKTASGETFAKDVTDFVIRKEVLDKIRVCMPELSMLCIVSNQGGIAKGYFSKHDFDAKMRSICAFIVAYLNENVNDTMIDVFSFYCTSTDSADMMRKPNTGMLDIFYGEQLHYAAPFLRDKANMLMIGDASGKEGDFSDSDKVCAERFGIDYLDVDDFLTA
ncbi:MAG: HAD-IIIA family hydrolase [Prevotella sp.]|nr:HAD-IIIA family hydrolase [Prevotella sp.]